jgi:anti-anti-sigma regulatory factor
MFKIVIEEVSEEIAKIHISGELTLVNIASVHEAICEIKEKVEEVVICLDDVSGLDMSFAQLMCTSHRSFTLSDKRFSLEGDKNIIFDKTDALGYTRHKGCKFDKFKDCVFVK